MTKKGGVYGIYCRVDGRVTCCGSTNHTDYKPPKGAAGIWLLATAEAVDDSGDEPRILFHRRHGIVFIDPPQVWRGRRLQISRPPEFRHPFELERRRVK